MIKSGKTATGAKPGLTFQPVKNNIIMVVVTYDTVFYFSPHLNPLPQWRRGESPFSPLVSTHRVTGWDEGIFTYAKLST